MRTLVISDLHLGLKSGHDVLRVPELRAPLIARLADVDRLVILGDGLELRESPHRNALSGAEEFLSDVARALPRDAEVVWVPGNHDHGLIAGWIDARLQTEAPGFLSFEERINPSECGQLARTVAEALDPLRFSFAYPGLWLRDDIYAFHGHYLDVHSTVPTFERLAAASMAKWIAPLPEGKATPDHYEAVLSPMYAWLHALTQRSGHEAISGAAGASARAWVVLAGAERRYSRFRAAVLGLGYAGLVASLNAIGLGPLQRKLSPYHLRRGGLIGMSEVLRRIDLAPKYVVFGHTHRSGPRPDDDLREWETAAGTQLVNSGCWIFQNHFLMNAPQDSPYWPGNVVMIDGEGPPAIVSLLADYSFEDFKRLLALRRV